MTFPVMILALLYIDLKELFYQITHFTKLYILPNYFSKITYDSFIIEYLLRDLYINDLVSSFNNENLV